MQTGNGEYNWIVWIVFGVLMSYISFFIMLRIRRKKRQRVAQQLAKAELLDEYNNLTTDKILSCPDEDLVDVVLGSLNEKEDKYEDFFERITHPERVIYGIISLNDCISGGTGIRPFFHSPATERFVPVIDQYLDEIGAYDAALVVRYARRLDEIIENDLDDEDMGEYSTYNFSDFTHEYITLVAGTNFMTKIYDYIRSHAESFVNEKESEQNEA